MNTGPGHGRFGIRRQPRHPPAPERRLRRAHDGSFAEARTGRSRDADRMPASIRADGSPSFPPISNATRAGADAVTGCDYVIHVASPIPAAAPKTEDELIRPARDGVLRVLRAARDAKVRRVVLTSSCGAIYYGHPPQTAPFDETSWTNIDGDMSAYVRSKAIAERAAWDFMSAEGGSLELSAINPCGHLRTDARGRLLILHRARDATDERHARLPPSLLRRRRRARRGGPAPAGDDASRRARRALHRHVGRHHVDARDRHGPPRTPWRRGQESADAGASELAGHAWRRYSIAT